ncbi:hypothetical protein FGE05_12780 [Pseudomonas sp. ICMP22404]|nr:hypothetical protein FGE05_12780 [Pseudomonas sp. ICMP22404]
MGASLLAKAVGQIAEMSAVPPSSRAGSLPQRADVVTGCCDQPAIRVGGVCRCCVHPEPNVGASLLAIAAKQLASILTVPAHREQTQCP